MSFRIVGIAHQYADGRSLSDLLDTIQHLEACGVDQQAIDTTTPMGKLVFQLTGAFAEFDGHPGRIKTQSQPHISIGV
jgi:DNA invertase Pin-like site-specific DNA recombinase